MTRHPVAPPPDLDWREGGIPVSNRFGDIYFSPEDGLAETAHVFLAGNGLPEAWARADRFVIGETGFGTGLNFLAAWDLWRRTAPAHARLHFLSAEAFPLTRDQLAKSHAPFAQVGTLSAALRDQWEVPLPGFHRLHFDGGRVTLTLLHGDAAEVFQEMDARVDAWFLDGFAPSRNPDMWSPALFRAMAAASKPGTSLATFTVAGAVRRGLAEAGFTVEKRAGFGSKRDMLAGRFDGEAANGGHEPWFAPPKPSPHPKSAVIIGGGIAGASAAAALARRGISPILIEAHGRLAAEASGNPLGLMMPRLTVDDTLPGRFHTAAFAYARRLHTKAGLAPLDGLLQLIRNDEELKRARALLHGRALPRDWMRFVSRREASTLAGLPVDRPALYFPTAGSVVPGEWAEALMPEGAELRADTVTKISYDGAWRLDLRSGNTFTADLVILANGMGASLGPEGVQLSLRASRGQVTTAPLQRGSGLTIPVTYSGYAGSIGTGSVVMGATYDRLTDWSVGTSHSPTSEGHEAVLDLARAHLPALYETLNLDALSGRTSIRATTPDHMPLAGPVADSSFYASAYEALVRGASMRDAPTADYWPNLYCFTGLGSRGLVTAPLLGEVIASQISGDPMPISVALQGAIHPARFMVKALKRNQFSSTKNGIPQWRLYTQEH